MNEQFVLWLTGRSGSGKSTIAALLCTELAERGLSVRCLDENKRPKPEFDPQSAIHVCAYTSPTESSRKRWRGAAGKFVLVFVDAPERELRRRDVRGWFRLAAAGDPAARAALAQPYETPARPDIHLRTDMQTPLESTGRILGALEDSGLIPLVEL
jgi:adenylylsulfate kinase-like enzyme